MHGPSLRINSSKRTRSQMETTFRLLSQEKHLPSLKCMQQGDIKGSEQVGFIEFSKTIHQDYSDVNNRRSTSLMPYAVEPDRTYKLKLKNIRHPLLFSYPSQAWEQVNELNVESKAINERFKLMRKNIQNHNRTTIHFIKIQSERRAKKERNKSEIHTQRKVMKVRPRRESYFTLGPW